MANAEQHVNKTENDIKKELKEKSNESFIAAGAERKTPDAMQTE